MKCLDLFAHDIVNRTELIVLLQVRRLALGNRVRDLQSLASCAAVTVAVQDIFGSKNAALLEEFKSVLLSRGTIPGPAMPEDAWYVLPVSEIDFSECQQCTPSYRALPDQYPRHTCSERTEWEKEVRPPVRVARP